MHVGVASADFKVRLGPVILVFGTVMVDTVMLGGVMFDDVMVEMRPISLVMIGEGEVHLNGEARKGRCRQAGKCQEKTALGQNATKSLHR